MNDIQFARTMSIVRQLGNGKHLKMGEWTVAMDDDMTIGFLYNGNVTSSITLAGLNQLCEEYGIGFAVPSRKVKK